ncbi:MAG: hypothetical protein LBS69_08785 [Prevotellaceae bacterium]|jgi:hypothetical protein|nr:hypothetical protein [Prevotellaceae bacterium]
MNTLKIPLDFTNADFYQNNKVEEKDISKSITEFIKLLVDSTNGSFRPDYNFGFSLKNHQYENIYLKNNKNEIIIEAEIRKTSNEFANNLKDVIKRYETRLSEIKKIKSEIKKEKRTGKDKNGNSLAYYITEVVLSVSGTLLNGKPYNENFKLNIWS